MSHRVSNPGATADILVSNTCSRVPLIWRKRSLLQMTSSVSGRNITTGRGQLRVVSLATTSTLPASPSR